VLLVRRTETLLSQLRERNGSDFDSPLEKMFSFLAHVDAAGTESRRRALRGELMVMPAPIPDLVEKLVEGRLLTAEDTGGQFVNGRHFVNGWIAIARGCNVSNV
jgi:hypothetical protein